MSDSSSPRPILVATDLSARSDRAIDRAIQLAGELGAPLVVCHALPSASALAGDRKAAEAELRDALPDPQMDAILSLPVGPSPQAIPASAAAVGARAIVTGIARFNSLGDYVLGTMVEHLVRNAVRPVFVIKKRAHRPYRKILVATDFSTCSLHALQEAAALFPEAEFHLYHAWHVGYEGWKHPSHMQAEAELEGRARLDEFLASAGIEANVSVHLEHGDFGNVTLAMLARVSPDLVVLGTHGKRGFIRSVAGSTAMAALEWIDCDAMVAREPA